MKAAKEQSQMSQKTTMMKTLMGAGTLAAGLILGAGPSHGASGATFLKIDVGARTAAMGGAYVAMAEGPEGLWVNPASVGLAKGKRAMLMHNDYIGDISQEYVGYEHEMEGGRGNWGLSYMSMDLGSQQGFTAGNVFTGTFTPTDSVLSLGYGKKVNERTAAGVSLKYISSEIGNFSDTAFALDLGVIYKVPNLPLRIGASVQNIGDGLQLGATADDLPTLFRIGAAYRVPATQWLWSLEGEFAQDEDPVWKLGTEYALTEMIRLRGGYNTSNDLDNGYTYGVGIIQPRYTFNYAYIPFGTFGNTHRFSLDLLWD